MRFADPKDGQIIAHLIGGPHDGASQQQPACIGIQLMGHKDGSYKLGEQAGTGYAGLPIYNFHWQYQKSFGTSHPL